MNKTFNSKYIEGFQFNFLALPGANYFKLEIVNLFGSNIERVINKQDNKNVYGISHFTEHLSFRATKDYSSEELLKILKSDGEYNASTDHDRINYFFRTTMQKMGLAVKLVFNYAFNDLKNIPNEEFEIEKKVVYNEAKRYADNDQTMFYFNSVPTVCGYHAEDNVIGIPETIETFTKDDAIMVKDLFLTHGRHVFNVTYDPLKQSEEYIINEILKEIKRFDVKTLDFNTTGITRVHDELLGIPNAGVHYLPNESEQAMNMLFIDNIDNVYTARLGNKYLANYSETSLDDIIREKNGLTYGISLEDHNVSYSPYTIFSCDVSRGTEKTLMRLFDESINASVDNFNEEKLSTLMEIMQLKRTLGYINLKNYEIMHEVALWDGYLITAADNEFAENIDNAILELDKQFANFDVMNAYLKDFKNCVNEKDYSFITNVKGE